MGLQISPVIPKEWRGFSPRRIFRGVTYIIKVERSGSGNTISLTANDKLIDGDIVPFAPDGTDTVQVHGVLR